MQRRGYEPAGLCYELAAANLTLEAFEPYLKRVQQLFPGLANFDNATLTASVSAGSAVVVASKVDNEWQALARDTYLEDLEWQQRSLTVGALRHRTEDGAQKAPVGNPGLEVLLPEAQLPQSVARRARVDRL